MDKILPGQTAGQLGLIAVIMFAATFAGLLCYLPPIRRFAGLLVPLDPRSFVHATALATVVTLTVILAAPLFVLHEPPMLLMMHNGNIAKELADSDQRLDTIFGFLWLVPSGILAVGFPLYRTFGEACRRVGLVVPSIGQVAFGLAAAVALVGAMSYGVEPGIDAVWKHFKWPTTDGKAFEELMKSMVNPVGAIIIGVTAGIGEELFTRGILQPRLGILLSNLLFTAMHALQYNWDGLAAVFLIGLILGVIRKYTNTTTSGIVHGTYDFILVFGASVGWFNNV